MSKRFAGKHVLITGGGRGMGFEIARQFGNEGARLTLFDWAQDLLDDAAQKLKAQGCEVHPFQVDVSQRSQVVEAVDAAEQIAPIDVLINNAGVAYETPFLNLEEAEWRKVIDVNLTGYFLVAQAVCRYMTKRRKGVVINMASKNGMAGEFGYTHYDASKGGIIMLTRTMSLELAHLGIRVNAVCPGYCVTPMSAEIDSPEFVENFVDRYIPMNRHGRVEDIAPAFLFLASDDAA
ncbi:SDR family NAD(P)-dependent oxidoreductase, partial [candidate division KSB3 bacterium]|nr:SDR family NAD(P)-dependent oxidoreductase [candidate division KSB3 bacterium]MBD3324077.1 SDR family NAD(P)-dependent oxidoreductase [candidate division KSB3 bacterium]